MVERRIKILLVEDDPDDVWVMRNLLSDRWDVPYETGERRNALGGDRRCGDDVFDVILLDLSLPDSQGLETFFTCTPTPARCPSWCSRPTTTKPAP